MPVNAMTGNAYNGINVVSLWVSAEGQGFASPIFFKEYESQPDPDNADDDCKRRVARASYVLDASQVDGYTIADASAPLGPIERLQAVETCVANTCATIAHGGERAFYRPSTDRIQMPDETHSAAPIR